MTSNQRITFFADYWRKVCLAQGWPVNDRGFRLAKLSEWLGRPITSTSQLNTTTDYDVLKRECLAILQPANLKAQVELQNQAHKRLIFRAIELANELSTVTHPNYVETILLNRFGVRDVSQLDDVKLKQLCVTFNRCLHTKRQPAQAKAQPAPAFVPGDADESDVLEHVTNKENEPW